MLNSSQELKNKQKATKVIASCMIGNALEWYDFVIYAYFASKIGKLFFPSADEMAQLISAYGVFAIGFLTRPIGAILFGHIGDKFSRKTALSFSIYVMSIPTFLIGCLPTYAEVGILAPLLLTVLRILQGIAIGGEFTGSMVFMVEHATNKNRGFFGSFACLSLVLGVIIGSLLVSFMYYCFSENFMIAWGWRIAFYLSIFGSFVGIYMRKSLADPTEYLKEKKKASGGYPVKDLFANYKSNVMTVIGIDFVTAIGFYLVTMFLPTYFEKFLNIDSSNSFWIHTVNMCIFGAFIVLGGRLSDKYGRAKMIKFSCMLFIIFSVPIFSLMQMGSIFLVILGQFLLVFFMGLFFGPIPAIISEVFPVHVRFSGLSISHNLSMGVFGGPTPMIAAILIQKTGIMIVPAFLLILASVLSILSVPHFVKKAISSKAEQKNKKEEEELEDDALDEEFDTARG